ncbi:MAG: SIMPL domain-containing protein [Candidatus Saccharimonadia bacterium]
MHQLNFKIDFRILCILLVLVILAMLYFWRPWIVKSTKTITVTGSATITATPDSYVFSPTYNATGTTSADALSKVSTTGNTVVNGLKALGVSSSEISTNVYSDSGAVPLGVSQSSSAAPNMPVYYGALSATYGITVTLSSDKLVQKVSDYLATTSANGTVTPQAEFSSAKSSSLEMQARAEAVANAKLNASSEASQLSTKLGKVETISDSSGGGVVVPLSESSSGTLNTPAASAPIVLSGTQQVSAQVSVVFELQ